MPKLFSLKSLALAIATLMTGLLSACQSTPLSYQPTPTTLTTQVRTPAQHAQQELVNALSAHLNSERYAVSSYRYHTEPLALSEIDKGADNAWTTFAKVMAFKNNARYGEQTNPMPYMSASDYLGENGELGHLPYLRYDDEKNGTTPDTVSRSVGMSHEYQAINEEIQTLYNTFIIHLLYTDVQTFVDKKGNFNQQAFTKELTDLEKTINQNANELLKVAQGYQKSDIRHMQSCLADYKKSKLDIAKHIKNGDDIENATVAFYQAEIHANLCLELISTNTILEPYHYIYHEVPQLLLGTKSANKRCLSEQMEADRKLIKAGKNYYKNSNEFAQNTGVYYACEAVNEVSDDDYGDDLYADNDPYAGTFGWVRAYGDMKASQKQTDNQNNVSPFANTGLLGVFFKQKSTPEQVIAKNLYQYQHLSITGLSHQNPTALVGKSLYSIDYDSPTSMYSVQLPVRADYGRGELTADVSAFLPLVALASPKNAPLPKDVPHGLMSFALPSELAQQLPTDVIHQAINKGIVAGVQSLSSENFTPVDIRGDDFAKQVGASRAIKINMNTKSEGKFYSVIAKQVGAELKAYVDSHPQYYADKTSKSVGDDGQPLTTPNKVKKAIDDFTSLSTSYHSDDVGSLLQIIEGISPFALDGAVYIYFNSAGQIIAQQVINEFHDTINGKTTHSISQTRYDKGLFDKHTLARQFHDTFAQHAQVDGVALIKQASEQSDLEKEARYARASYDYDYDYYNGGMYCSPDDTVCQAMLEAAPTTP